MYGLIKYLATSTTLMIIVIIIAS